MAGGTPTFHDSREVSFFQVSRHRDIDRFAGLKVPCNYYLTAMGKFALLRYLSEF